MMSFNDASKPFSVPTWLICPWFPRGRVFPWKYVEARSLGNLEKHVALASFRKARSLGNLEKHVALASFRRGGAAVFRALGQGSFRGTTPMELDDYSKAFYPPS
ncbi:hypothetical protein F2Q68_00004627 [Brassica cretica]|uniref:Uncharacterized protein n=1 Tax=Brassica cretica TaxID=69181 RepID=A0A8S9JF36_BRACR|nr:hypothetical protein F2Q68_00004627 [Brassica cretica]